MHAGNESDLLELSGLDQPLMELRTTGLVRTADRVTTYSNARTGSRPPQIRMGLPGQLNLDVTVDCAQSIDHGGDVG